MFSVSTFKNVLKSELKADAGPFTSLKRANITLAFPLFHRSIPCDERLFEVNTCNCTETLHYTSFPVIAVFSA